MIAINDIYYKIGSNLAINNFEKKDIETKKIMLDDEQKKYIVEKIYQINQKNITEKELNTLELLEILANLIPKEQHFDTLRHFTHHILNIASIMQGWEIIWIVEERPSLIEYPEVNFDENNKLNNLITHKDTDYVKCFAFIYDVFSNNFMKEYPTKILKEKKS